MVELIPKWLHRRFILLRTHFGNRKFTFQEALDFLQEDSRIINLLLAGLRNYGWLTSEKDPENKRRRYYKLKTIDKVYEELEENVQIQNRKK